MPLAKAATVPTRKRNRKRKRRAASSSSSSSSSGSSSSSSSEDDSPRVTVVPISGTGAAPKTTVEQDSSDSESDSESSSASSKSSSSVRSSSPQPATVTETVPKSKRRRDSHSPSPPPTNLPSFLPLAGTEGSQQRQEELKARFRKFWMASVADGFRADLEELHKEPNLTESRLSLLIDSLASGADVFMSDPSGNSTRGLESISGINEMEVVLDGAA